MKHKRDYQPWAFPPGDFRPDAKPLDYGPDPQPIDFSDLAAAKLKAGKVDAAAIWRGPLAHEAVLGEMYACLLHPCPACGWPTMTAREIVAFAENEADEILDAEIRVLGGAA